jgi:TolA-binding protein
MNMKKTIILLCWLLSLQQPTFTQRSAHYVAPERLLTEGKTMFAEGNYAGCKSRMTEFLETQPDASFREEAEYFAVASDFHTGRADVAVNLADYLYRYPATPRRNDISFMLGSAFFRMNDCQQTVFWLQKTDIDLLSERSQEDYAYRLGVASCQTGNRTEARRLLSLLKSRSASYRNAATFYLGCIDFVEGDYKTALQSFNDVKNVQEFRPDALYYIAQINFAQGKYEQAIKEGRELVEACPSHDYTPETYRIIGLSYYQTGDYQKALVNLNSYVNQTDNVAPADYYALGLSNFYLNDYKAAIDNLNLSNPGNDALGQSVYLHLGQAYLKKNDANNALMAFQSASRMDFDPATKEAATYNYAMLLHQNSVSAFGESVTVLENFVNTYPNSVYADRVNNALVDVYLTTKDYNTALASIAKIKNPGSKIREAQQKIYYYLGTVSFTNNDLAGAEQYFSKAIAAGSYAPTEKSESNYWRGETLYKQGQYAKAASDFQAFVNSGVKSGNLQNMAIYNLAYCAFNQQQYETARRYFVRYTSAETANSPTLADAWARLGDCYFFARQFADAETAYNRSVSITPQKGDYAQFQKAYILGLQKDYQGKIAQMDRLIADYPESIYLPDAMYEKGRACVLLENSNLAIQTYRDLCARFPDNANARKAGLQIGLLLFNANRNEEAAAAYKEVIAKYPGTEEARTALQDLKSVYLDMGDVGGYAAYVNSLGGDAKFDVSEQDSLTYLAAERYFARNDWQQARKNMLAYLQSFPNGAFSINAHYYTGQTYYKENNFAAAKPEFRYVVDAGNNQFTEEALVRLSEICYSNGEYEEAFPLYERLQNTAANKSDREIGAIGLIRTAARLNRQNQVMTSANALLKTEPSDPAIATEARYYRAKAAIAIGENSIANTDLRELSKDTRTAFGAEAKYLLAQRLFDNNQSAQAKEIVQEYIKQGTSHSYWLARSFILMADICAANNETLLARQYLESLQNSYKAEGDDINSLINNRLQKLK